MANAREVDLLDLAARLTAESLRREAPEGAERQPEPAAPAADAGHLRRVATPPVADLQGEAPIVAVKVWSAILGEAVWVMADDLPRAAWPQDAPVYTQTEARLLAQVGPETLPWVQVLKTLFGARVVAVSAHPTSAVVGGHRQ